MQCLLCNSSDLKQVAKVPVREIINAYLKSFKTDFSYLFKEKEISLVECNACGLKFYTPIVTGDDHYYNVLQKFSWYYREDKEEYKYAASLVSAADKVLDIGCGKGAFAKFIPHADFTGLEFSSDAVKTGTENGQKIIMQSIQDHALSNPGAYDVVTAFQVLEHVSDIAEFLKAAAASVKPGGKLIIAVPSDESYIKYHQNAFLNMPPHHMSRWTDRALTNVADVIKLKLELIHHEKMDPIHKADFLSTQIERILRLNLRKQPVLVNSSIGYKVRKKVANIAALRLSRTEVDDAWFGIGQTVIAIYSK